MTSIWKRTVAICFLLGAVALGHPKTVLGKLGQTIKATSIYALPSTRSLRYSTVRAYEYVVLRPCAKPGWYRILLQNMRLGYIKSSTVASLPWEVTTKRPSATRPSFPPSVYPNAGTYVASQSLRYVGTPYKWGGNDIENGIDCSAFVKKLYGAIGVNLPRTAAQQALVGQPILRLEDLRPGDRLYFWSKQRNKIGHTGIYLGGNYFIHSSTTNKGVATDYLPSKKWLSTLVDARR